MPQRVMSNQGNEKSDGRTFFVKKEAKNCTAKAKMLLHRRKGFFKKTQ
jgi:hypothetical protein